MISIREIVQQTLATGYLVINFFMQPTIALKNIFFTTEMVNSNSKYFKLEKQRRRAHLKARLII
jgi:hypothetical protein